MCKVSICIPAFNQADHLRRNLDSILMQTFTDYEVIITDDSGHHDLEVLIRRYDFGGRLKYFHNPVPLGSPRNWNYGISKASGTYIKPMHHDDWFSAPDSLAKIVALFESGDNSMAFCGCNNISGDGTTLFRHAITQDEEMIIRDCPAFLFYNNRIGSPSVTLFRRGGEKFDEKNQISGRH